MPTIVAVAGGVGGPILAGQDAMLAIIKATKDPMTLASAAMAIAKEDAELLTTPKNDKQEQERVGPPVIEGNTLTFWIWTRGVGRELFLGKLDLATGAYQRTVQQLSHDELMTRYIGLLASNNPGMERSGVESLTASCASNEKARTALLDAAAHHNREETRAAAVDASPACGVSAVDVLIYVLEQDASSKVRWKAANALGKIGDLKAKPALQRATNSSDPDVKAAAIEALGKLK